MYKHFTILQHTECPTNDYHYNPMMAYVSLLHAFLSAGDQGVAGPDRQRQGCGDERHLEGRDVQGGQRATEGVRQPNQPDPAGLREQDGVPGKLPVLVPVAITASVICPLGSVSVGY